MNVQLVTPYAATFAPFAATALALALAVVFTKLWVDDASEQATRHLARLGIQTGSRYRLGGSWFVGAMRERNNLRWALLAATAWIALLVALDIARR